jgi:hypothetical protein
MIASTEERLQILRRLRGPLLVPATQGGGDELNYGLPLSADFFDPYSGQPLFSSSCKLLTPFESLTLHR